MFDWLIFACTIPVCVIFLYLPGYIFFRCLHYESIVSFCAAPVLSVSLYVVLGLIYSKVGIFSSWLSMLIPSVIVLLFWYILVNRVSLKNLIAQPEARKEIFSSRLSHAMHELQLYIPYLVVGILICFMYFIIPLDGTESFTWKTDNTFHLGVAWNFVKTGVWSCFDVSLFENYTQASLHAYSYYPTAWHILVAMISGAVSRSAAFGANVINTMLISVTYTSSQYLLIRTLFRKKILIRRIGAVLPLAFGVFPWRIIVPHAKYSFFMGIVLLPIFLVSFIMMIENVLSAKLKPRDILFTFISMFACVCSHPSMIFTAGVLLVPYIIYSILRACQSKNRTRLTRVRGIVLSIIFFILVCITWYACCQAPYVHSVVMYVHKTYSSKAAAVAEAVTLGFKYLPLQLLLAILVWLGVIYTIYLKRYLWLSISFIIFCLLFVISATMNGLLKHYLTGFWYTDPDRLGTSACVVGVSLAALGLELLIRLLQHIFDSMVKHKHAVHFRRCTIPLIAVFLFFCVNYYPSFKMHQMSSKTTTCFGYILQLSMEYNDEDQSELDTDERKFLDQVKEITGDDLVLNIPHDGSAFAYITDDINVYFRRYYANKKQSIVIERGLCDIAYNKRIQRIVKKINARYVLLLNHQFNSEIRYLWPGIFEITDETPGFTIVLAEGDMRLYEIEY